MKNALSVIACALLVIAATGCSRPAAWRHSKQPQSEVAYQSASQSSGGAPVVNDVTFDSEVGTAKVALVDFNARWCGPCRRMGPVIDALAAEMGADAKVMKLDIDESTQTADKYDVHSIPCLIVFKDGREVERHYGLHTRDEVKAWLSPDRSVSLAQ
jgi:thioredoxin 1